MHIQITVSCDNQSIIGTLAGSVIQKTGTYKFVFGLCKTKSYSNSKNHKWGGGVVESGYIPGDGRQGFGVGKLSKFSPVITLGPFQTDTVSFLLVFHFA